MSSERESSLVTDLRALSEDEELLDVTLRGTDGREVPASRTILAARSKVLRRMLCGNFVEARSSVVSLPFHGSDLRTIVKFFFTDEIQCVEDLSLEERVRSLVRVVSAGHYFECPMLERKAYEVLNPIVLNHPPLACAVLDEVATAGATSVDLRSVALRIIETKPVASLLPTTSFVRHGGVASIREESVLREIILDDHMETDELTMFMCLKKWAADDMGTKSFSVNGAVVVGGSVSDRIEIAKAIATKLNLSRVQPSDLVSVVAESGLVTSDQLMEAYKAHALSAERAGLVNNEPRAVPWNSREFVLVHGAATSVVNGPYLVNGVSDGIPCYSKTDVWEGRKVSLFIFRIVCDRTAIRRWFISVFPEGKRPGSEEHFDIYRSLCIRDETSLPLKVWQATSNGADPPPICRFVVPGNPSST